MSLRNDLAAHIRHVDGNNALSPAQLGAEIAAYLRHHGHGHVHDEATENAVEDYAEAANTGSGYLQSKRMGAAALADAIVDHFHLEG